MIASRSHASKSQVLRRVLRWIRRLRSNFLNTVIRRYELHVY
jgi:hypothetical protein